MKLYGVLYEDIVGEAGRGVDTHLHVNVLTAVNAAREQAESVADELNEFDDGSYGPYEVVEETCGDGMKVFNITNRTGVTLESFSVVEFDCEGVAVNC